MCFPALCSRWLIIATARLPIGVVSPIEVANDKETVFTYRNFGHISLNGADVSFSYDPSAN